RRVTVAGVADHGEVLGGCGDNAQAGADERLVVDEEDRDHSVASSRQRSPTGPLWIDPPARRTRSASPTSPAPAPGKSSGAAVVKRFSTVTVTVSSSPR